MRLSPAFALCGCLCVGAVSGVSPALGQQLNTDLEDLQVQLDINADERMDQILARIDALQDALPHHRVMRTRRVLEDERSFTSGGGYGLEGR